MRNILKKKTLRVYLVVALALICGIWLCTCMYKYVVPVKPEYVIPYNIGIRWATLFGMAAILLFQNAIYVALGCNKTYRKEVFMYGIWIANVIALPEIVSNSKLSYYLKLRDNIGEEIGYIFSLSWDILEYELYIIVALIAIRLIYIGITAKKGDMKCDNCRSSFAMVMAIVGGILLLLRCWTNDWYILLCLGTFKLSWFVQGRLGVLWQERYTSRNE